VPVLCPSAPGPVRVTVLSTPCGAPRRRGAQPMGG
jgi:hypothetical protein